MKWQDDARNLLRTICGDVISPYQYDDTRLDDLLFWSAKIILRESNLADIYSVDEVLGEISPDPADDNWFLSLLSLKAWEILAGNEYRLASTKSLSIKDGASSIDARGIAENAKVIAAKAAEDYKKSLFDYNMGKNIVGKAVVSPFRVYSEQIRQSTYGR